VSEEIKRIHTHVEAMRMRSQSRERDSYLVRLVRAGKLHEEFPGHFADSMPQMAIANAIDNAARDTAELIAPLPSLACASGNMSSAADVARAAKKNKIASYYWDKSKLPTQNINFCDAAMSYAFGVYIIEPDWQEKCPHIRWESSFGSYWYKDRFQRTIWYAKITYVDVLTLVSKYPDSAAYIEYENGRKRSATETVQLVTYMDRDQNLVYLPDCGYHVLAQWRHNLGKALVAIAPRPDQEDQPRGQYDDAVFPMLAKHIITQYQLDAADKAINAPIAVPDDVTELPYGPNAVIRSQSGAQSVARVRLDIPDDVFAVAEQLDRAVKEGSRYPEARSGGISGNIVTGKGVEALAGTLNTQVKTMQTVIGQVLEEATALCFMLDVALWPNMQKRITGVLTGKPFELTYTPAKDIGESYACKVTYGFASGQTPAQALVALLQLRGDELISRDTTRRQLPFDLDPEEEQRQVDAEGLSSALRQGIMGLEQAIGPMVMQGQDPRQVLTAVAKLIQLRRKGKSIEDAALEAFTPPEPEEPAAPEGAIPEQAGPTGPGGPELPPGVRDNGLLEGVAYGQAGGPPGGMPAIQGLLSRLRGQGSPVMEASVSRRRAVGA
jgi:hypothetical protein